MKANLILAKEVIQEVQNSSQSTPTSTPAQPCLSSGTLNNYVPKNAPIVINPQGIGIRKCAGCKQPITEKEQQHPTNMLFKRIGICGNG